MPPLPAVGSVRVKGGVQFTLISPAGFRILAAVERAARVLRLTLVITSACDGAHSGPADPHHRGDAFDIRTHDWAEALKDGVLRFIIQELNDDGPAGILPVPGIPRSLATSRYFGFIEQPGTPNEHIHVQLRHNATYP
jgi:hypothetical protein